MTKKNITPAEKYENLIKRLGGTNQDLGEMQSIASEILHIGFHTAADYLEYFAGYPEAAKIIREYTWNES